MGTECDSNILQILHATNSNDSFQYVFSHLKKGRNSSFYQIRTLSLPLHRCLHYSIRDPSSWSQSLMVWNLSCLDRCIRTHVYTCTHVHVYTIFFELYTKRFIGDFHVGTLTHKRVALSHNANMSILTASAIASIVNKVRGPRRRIPPYLCGMKKCWETTNYIWGSKKGLQAIFSRLWHHLPPTICILNKRRMMPIHHVPPRLKLDIQATSCTPRWWDNCE